jgi:hypothetical protein
MAAETYYYRPSAVSKAQEMLAFLADSFRLNPLRNNPDDPKPEQWSGYLLQHPGFADSGGYTLAARVFAENRRSVDGLTPEMQNLAGSLICVKFDEQMLRNIADLDNVGAIHGN